jgi:hypothetical protein
MTKQYSQLAVYQLNSGVAFQEVGTSIPFLVIPASQAVIKPWGKDGFVFENLVTGDVIAFVYEYDDVLDSAGNPYGANQSAVLTALSAFFFELGGGGGAGDLDAVLTLGNSAGGNNIDLNGNKLVNVTEITATGDLILNPVGSINCNGKTIDMTGGEIHKCDLIHSQNNTDIVIEAKGTGDVILTTNNISRLKITDAGVFIGLPESIQLAASDETTALTTGTAKVTFRMPFAMTLTSVRASLTTAQTSGSIFTVDINENGSSILSTKLTIDNTEKTSVTAATPAVISDLSLADDAEITIDIDQVGDGTAKGLKITINGTRA